MIFGREAGVISGKEEQKRRRIRIRRRRRRRRRPRKRLILKYWSFFGIILKAFTEKEAWDWRKNRKSICPFMCPMHGTKIGFLDATSHLYKRSCPYVRPSVSLSRVIFKNKCDCFWG